ncbi:MAG TPA: phage tail tape measure protein [Stellaceae bacterium]|jgi:TP901 family phage tail tape measure protein
MSEDFEVSAILAVADRATGPMTKVLGLARDLTAQFERIKVLGKGLFSGTGVNAFGARLEKLNAPMINIMAGFDHIKAAAASAFLDMNKGLDATIDEVRVLRKELEGTALAARTSVAQAAGAAAAAGGGRGGAGGAHIRGRVPVGGPFHAGFGLNAPTGIAAALGYGAYQEAMLEHTVNRVMLAAGQNLLSPDLMKNPLSQQIREAVQSVISSTGMSAGEAEKAIMPLITQMGGAPLSDRINLIPEFLKFGFVEQQLKGVSPEEAVQSLVGMIHMSGTYNPDAMAKLARSVEFASTISPVGLPGIERAASYAVPTAITAGLDPNSILLTIATAQSAGILSGKAGTWFNGLITALSPKGGFASLLTGQGADKRQAGLLQLGLIDKKGTPTGLRMLEHGDFAGFSKTVADNLTKIPQEERLGVMSQAMGSIQAARALALMTSPAFQQRLPQLMEAQNQFLSGGTDDVIKALAAGDPTIQFKKTLGDLTNALMDLGRVVLPPLTEVLRSIDNTIKAFLPGSGGPGVSAGDVAKGAAVGAATGAYFGGVPGAVAGGAIGASVPIIGASNQALGQQLELEARKGFVVDPWSGTVVPLNSSASSASAAQPSRIAGLLQRLESLLSGGLTVHMDGEEVGRIVVGHMSADGDKPPSGPSSFDYRLSPVYPTSGVEPGW